MGFANEGCFIAGDQMVVSARENKGIIAVGDFSADQSDQEVGGKFNFRKRKSRYSENLEE